MRASVFRLAQMEANFVSIVGGGEGFLMPDLDHLTSGDVPIHDPDTPSIEAAMETFMAEYFHEDWGWDPFSGFTGLFDHPAEPS